MPVRDEAVREIERIVEGAGNLATLPAVYDQLQQALSDPTVSAREVGAVIERDQALTSKVLKVANSAFYGFPKRVSTVTQAVIILGFNEVKNIALSISIIDLFARDRGTGAFDQAAFWRHSVAAAIAAGTLARTSASLVSVNRELAFVAGLVHDVGKIVLDQHHRARYETAVRRSHDTKEYLVEAERKVLGFTHEQVGERITHLWNLPGTLVAAAGHHHAPLACRSFEAEYTLACTVHVADGIVRALGLGSGGDPFVPPACDECWKHLGVREEDLSSVVDETGRVYAELATFLVPEGGDE